MDLTTIIIITTLTHIALYITMRTLNKRATNSAVIALQSTNNTLSTTVSKVESTLREKEQELNKAHITIAELRTKAETESQGFLREIETLKEAKNSMTMEFQNIANKIFEEKSTSFQESSTGKLNNILGPLRTQMAEFKAKVEETYEKDMRDRVSLRKELDTIASLNQAMSNDTKNLTQALKGDNKAQGIWGEMIMERALESSGLRKDQEFHTQGSYRDEDNTRYIPDAVIHLPEDRDVIVDSKVSLTAYTRFLQEEDEAAKQSHIKAHAASLKKHVEMLAAKPYSSLKGLQSLDFVLMFVPVESAMAAAIHQQPDLLDLAFRNKIILVSPTTLMMVLKIIKETWHNEYQNATALKIIEDASKIYDKMAIFTEKLDKVGSKIKDAQTSYDEAMTSLCTGKGNVIRKLESLKEDGLKVKKDISDHLVRRSKVQGVG